MLDKILGKQGTGINLNKYNKQKFVKETIKKHADKEGLDKVKKFRKEASRMASMANKRIQRLEERGLLDSPAYKKWVVDGEVRFGVAGKNYNQVQAEVARMNRFIDSQTSTIRGLNGVLKDMAKNTGIKYKNIKELQTKGKQFFELASKVEQYLRTVDDMATAIGYQKIWEAINEYVSQDKVDLGDAEFDIDKAIDRVTKALTEYEKPHELNANSGAKGWYTLPKD